MKKNNEWPMLGVRSLSKSNRFYNNIGFSNAHENCTPNASRITMKLFDFCLYLQEGEIHGPIYKQSNHIQSLNGLDRKAIASIPILTIPIPSPAAFYDDIKEKEVEILCENRMLTHDFEGFYFIDNESNKILVCRDYHGPYNPHTWQWSWFDYLKYHESNASIFRKVWKMVKTRKLF